MRRWLSIAKATALEILSEPLSLLLFIASLTVATLTPAFHYHQFGEATRMARDAGCSALFLGGVLIAVFGTVRTYRREIETGTAQMALAHAVSRTGFFLAKAVGACCAVLLFCFLVALAVLTMVNGAAIGGALAAQGGDLPRIWGPSLALGVAGLVAPLVLAALLNRFLQCRYVLSFFLLAGVVALVGACYRFDAALAARLVPVLVLMSVPSVLVLSMTAAAAARLPANGAVSVVALLLAACVPAVGNYYLPDALSKGGSLPWRYVGLATLAILPAIGAFLTAGCVLFGGRDVTEERT